MEPGPPYDEFYLNHEIQKCVVDKFDKNDVYASPELLKIYWRFRYAHYNNPDEINRGLGDEIFNIVISEHDKLKEVIG